MHKKFISLLLAFVYIFSNAQFAQASNLPLMTWERGKEQSIVLNGANTNDNWKIKLIGENNSSIELKKSSINPNGLVVYSAFIPIGFPIGNYSVEVFKSEEDFTKVAGVTIVEINTYEIIRIPLDLKIVIFGLIFLLITITSVPRQSYSKINYLKKLNLFESNSNMMKVNFPRQIFNYYRIRIQSEEKYQKSLFWNLIKRDSALIQSTSISLWLALPILATFIGLISGYISKNSLPEIPFYLFLVIALVGIYDAYSGFFVGFGFASMQIIVGNVTSVRMILLLLLLFTGWSFSGLFGQITFFVFNFELIKYPKVIKYFLSSLASGVFFYLTQILIQSLALNVRQNRFSLYITAFFVTSIFLSKLYYSDWVQNKLLQKLSACASVEFHLDYIFSKTSIFGFSLFFLMTCYTWTSHWLVSIFLALLLSCPFLSFTQLQKTKLFSSISKLNRVLWIELILFEILAWLGLFLASKYALIPTSKSETFLIVGLVPLFLYSVYNNLYDRSVANPGSESK